MRRWLGPILTVILVIAVGAAIYASVSGQLAARQVITVRGLIGSEKEEFFLDQRVQAALRRNGLEVVIEKAGSREIADLLERENYDFAFPAGIPAATRINQVTGNSGQTQVFFTPMVIASWQTVADLLEAQGIVRKEGSYYYITDMAKLLEFGQDNTRWRDLKDANGTVLFNANRTILIGSTDVRRSNSAAMYLALISYVLNGDEIVDRAEAPAIAQRAAPFFLRQGDSGYSSEVPFEDYLTQGIGKAPMVMIYESQFLTEKARVNSPITDDMVLFYPEPTIFTRHMLVPLTEGGERLAQALTTDPELQQLAIEFGFRNSNTAAFRTFVEQHQLDIPQNLINIIDPPTYEVLETMIQYIEQLY